MLGLEFVEFEGHVFVLLVPSLWVSPVAKDSDYFLKSLHESYKVVVLLHSLVWAL